MSRPALPPEGEPRFEPVLPRFEEVPGPGPPVAWPPPGSASPRRGRGPAIAVAVVAILFVAVVGAAVLTYVNVGPLEPDVPQVRPEVEEFLEALNASSNHMTESYEALAASQYSRAEATAYAARLDVREAYRAYEAAYPVMTPEDRDLFLDGLILYQGWAEATLGMARTEKESSDLTSRVENASADEVLGLLPQYEILGRAFIQNADQWEGLADDIARIVRDRPRTATYFQLEADLADSLHETATSFRESGQFLRNTTLEYEEDEEYTPLDERELPHGERFDPTIEPPPEETTPPPTTEPSPGTSEPGPTSAEPSPTTTAPTPPPPDNETRPARASDLRVLKSYITPEVQSLFDGFDTDQSGDISFKESQDFYYWVEKNIQYRYDNEDYPNPYPGYPVGDGRPGVDYHQRPAETLAEKMGDCEDQNNLEVAFYEYWGILAYQALVNAELEYTVDHAIAIVYVGADASEAQRLVGNINYYTMAEGNSWGVYPGAYMIVDNAYSNSYGYIDGQGIQEGKFQVLEVHTLGEEWERQLE